MPAAITRRRAAPAPAMDTVPGLAPYKSLRCRPACSRKHAFSRQDTTIAKITGTVVKLVPFGKRHHGDIT